MLGTFGFRDYSASGPLCRHLTRHRVLNRRRRDDLPDLDVGDFHAPALGDLIEFRPKDLVHQRALREDIVEAHVTHNRTQGGRSDGLSGAGEVPDLDDRHDTVHDLVEDDEVDRNSRVVFRDGTLMRDVEIELSEIDPYRSVDQRDEDDETGAFDPQYRPIGRRRGADTPGRSSGPSWG